MFRKSKYLLIFLSILFSSYANSGAAEKWDYDVIPDTSQTLKVKGHKVDGYGNAVNDYEYNRKIDPKTAANRTKMGKVGFGRLLKISGWGILGTVALEGLLDSVGWIMDPSAQSIWRYKSLDTGGVADGLCKGGTVDDYSGKKVEILFWTATNAVGDCPLSAAENQLRYWSQTTGDSYVFVDWLDSADLNAGTLYWEKFFTYRHPQLGNRVSSIKIKTGSIVKPEQEKEYLTPEQLADYANHTHPDYSNPKFAPKLEPKYSPSIQTDLWKPANPWEYDNSPTVEDVKKELELAKPEPKDDTIKENEPDPETGGKSFSLPPHCSWATAVCDFFDWVKKDDLPERDDSDLNTTVDFEEKKIGLNVSPQCPAPTFETITLHGVTAQVKTSDYTYICQLDWLIKPFTIGFASVLACFILFGFNRGSED